jgi:hypothetical protein
VNDALLTIQDREEALSRVYARAVAAGAGYATADCDFDRDGVDLRIHAGGAMRPAIDLQLKATVNLGVTTNGDYRYPLRLRNYDLLREETQVPRLLLVLELPRDEAEWITIDAEQLVLRRRAYWLSLTGYGESPNQSSVTVRIPGVNVLDVNCLRALMDQSRRGRIE